ncbi:MAG: helix-turn-helix transcriptional regulator [Candidatus Eisenbacteria bacterium]|uniref:Helix-turn-helix transcriptional regulator n=1 Tax=Eiseniibacteriota bacterium TaxID=2212470 RepID=A0A937X996_UNCEI|nr:helix-turn-helix transcriptional regulator [Candidatus Eisenbacteria bacterium]
MTAKQTLAKRLRDTRHRRRMTLKEVERLSGFSSTHISEIERGRTSPTVKALVRIAEALAKDPCFFVESRELDDVSLVSGTAGGRPSGAREAPWMAPLSTGILGGRLRAYLARSEGPVEKPLEDLCGCDTCLYALAGSVRLQAGDEEFTLGPQESLHLRCAEAPILSVEEGPMELFVVAQPVAGLAPGRRSGS